MSFSDNNSWNGFSAGTFLKGHIYNDTGSDTFGKHLKDLAFSRKGFRIEAIMPEKQNTPI